MMIWYMYFRTKCCVYIRFTDTIPKMFKSSVINNFFLFPESNAMGSKMKGVNYYLSLNCNYSAYLCCMYVYYRVIELIGEYWHELAVKMHELASAF